MTQVPSCFLNRVGWVGAIAGILSVAPVAACAQSITTDGTLGPAVTLTGPEYTIGQDLGLTVRDNLFHSFSQFGLNAGENAIFQRAPDIRNILTRVTGGAPSLIDGQLRVVGDNVNLYFMNPNGIVFGPNAQLDVGYLARGSFIATTAHAIAFPGGQFSATNPNEARSLLTIVGDPSGFLAAQGLAPIQTFGSFLGVYGGQSLVLLGGNLTFDSANGDSTSGPSILGINGIEGGRVEFGSVASPGFIQLITIPSATGNLLSLNIPNEINRGDVALRHRTEVNVLGEKGGDISIYAQTINILEGSRLLAGIGGGVIGTQAGNITLNATGAVTLSGRQDDQNSQILNSVSDLDSVGNAGNILVTAQSLTITDGGEINSSTFGQGNAGHIFINAPTILLDAGFQGGGIFSGMDSPISGEGGNIVVTTDNLALTNGSTLNVSTTGQGNAGDVLIDARSLSVTGGAKIVAGTEDGANAGDVIITARDTVQVDGFGVDLTGQVIVENGNPLISQIISGVDGGNGQGGDIRITTGSLLVTNGGELTANTFGAGNAGNILVNVRDAIALGGRLKQDSFDESSGLFARTYGSGQGGNIILQPVAGKQSLAIQFQDDAQISALSEGSGQGGSILLTAPQAMTLNGFGTVSAGTLNDGIGGNIQFATQQLVVQNSIEVSASTFGSGRAGDIGINAATFSLSGGAKVSTNTANQGSAGNLIVNLHDQLTLMGNGTGLFAITLPGSSGNGGNIVIDPRLVQIGAGAAIAVNSQGSGTGGSIDIRAGRLVLRDRGSITAETASAQGGNITLEVQDLLLLRRNSFISATAGTAQDFGNGGNIRIRAPFLIGAPGENSDITANAFRGNGGRITIDTNAIFGLEYRPQLSPFSDITASSQFGLSGTVAISTLNVDPSRGLVALPVNLTDPSQEISQACNPMSKTAASSFVATGRGGLPLNPEEPLERGSIVPKWVPLPEEHGAQGLRTAVADARPSSSQLFTPIVEAQSIRRTADGTLVLVAQAVGRDRTTVTLPSIECPATSNH